MNNLRIATYNIRMETPSDTEDLWSDRKTNVMKIMQDYDFDIIGFQEVKESQLNDLKKMTNYDSFGLGRSKDESNEYNPIFYKKAKIDKLKSDTFWLSSTFQYEEKSKRWDADCPRICTWGHFRIKATEKEFYVFNTHFDHISEISRYRSAEILLNKFSSIDQETPIFLTGDFNGGNNERFYSLILSKLIDVVPHSPHHIGPKATCTGVGFNHELSWDKYQLIDYIFANTCSKINKTMVITDQFSGRYTSDHFPVCLDTTLT
ncbi:endonuclease/exonuclease/phosphatase family protein [Niallia sp. 03133]|uniref:endonuclease/exonuclease/phosphatase family protein n=1 Tax=Niallia sp. 03133 TaxID=3458060 RepID=UPI004043E73F